MRIIPVYAALLAVLFVYLSVRVISIRRVARIGIGTGGNAKLARASRVQANFAEYVPFALLLLAMLELKSLMPLILHGLGAALLIGRGLHAYGVSGDPENLRFRVSGMMVTFTVILLSAVLLIWSVV
jgi:uncharacterized protein